MGVLYLGMILSSALFIVLRSTRDKCLNEKSFSRTARRELLLMKIHILAYRPVVNHKPASSNHPIEGYFVVVPSGDKAA